MELKLTAESRTKNEKLSKDDLAGILYGRGLESRSVKVKLNNFAKLFEQAGESNLITLHLEDKEFPVLVKTVQRDVLKNTLIHVDFYQVNMKEKVKAEIPLEFIGASKAVSELGGVFLSSMDEVAAECLPADLVDHIDVDISNLNEFGDMIRISDLKLPKGITLEHDDSDVVCVVEEPKKVEDEPVVAAPVEAAPAGETKEETPETK
ncbi:MAG: 50S ribosomal protein L25 [bacterium]|nr:50S ribosomal protein L25 [bacterium]